MGPQPLRPVAKLLEEQLSGKLSESQYWTEAYALLCLNQTAKMAEPLAQAELRRFVGDERYGQLVPGLTKLFELWRGWTFVLEHGVTKIGETRQMWEAFNLGMAVHATYPERAHDRPTPEVRGLLHEIGDGEATVDVRGKGFPGREVARGVAVRLADYLDILSQPI